MINFSYIFKFQTLLNKINIENQLSIVLNQTAEFNYNENLIKDRGKYYSPILVKRKSKSINKG